MSLTLKPQPSSSTAPRRGSGPLVFSDRLAGKLELSIESDSFTLQAGSFEHVHIDAAVHGFSAEVTFVISSEQQKDELFPRFLSDDLITATLSLANGNKGFADEKANPWKLKGVVVERRVTETTTDDRKGLPVIRRHYTLRFLDHARALWSQHWPIELYAGHSMKKLLEQHVPTGMQLDLAWQKLDKAQDILCVGLGAGAEASFYDFVIWFLHENNGVLELDPAEGKYRLGGAKAKGDKPKVLDPELIAEIGIIPSEQPRHAAAIVNGAVQAAVHKKDIANAKSVTGLRRDVLLRTTLQTDVDERVTLETARLSAAEPGLEITLRRCPPALVFLPGAVVTLGKEIGENVHSAKKKYRVIGAELVAHSTEESADLEDENGGFELSVRLRLERQNDPTPRLPPFRRPAYPVIVEGKILAASGGDDERTWHMLEGESDSLHRYRMQITTWNKTIIAPFVPGQVPGQLYFPAYKNQRVLVAIHFNSAEIIGYLDWADRLAQDTLGNQIVLGKSDKNETTIKHVYADNKPKLLVERRMGLDVETLIISEGAIKFEVKEEKGQKPSESKANLKPTVDAAKERAAGEVRESVGEMSGQHESAMGDATGSVDAANAAVEAKLDEASGKLAAKAEAVETELQGLMSNATESLEKATAKVAEAKSALVNAFFGDGSGVAPGFGQLRGKLAMLEGRPRILLVGIEAQAKNSKKDIETIGRDALALFGRVEAKAKEVEGLVGRRFEAVKAAVKRLGPPQWGGSMQALWKRIDSTSATLGKLEGEAMGAATRARNKLGAEPSEMVGEWKKLGTEIPRIRAQVSAELQKLEADVQKETSTIKAAAMKKARGPSSALASDIEEQLEAAKATLTALAGGLQSEIDSALKAIEAQVQSGIEGAESGLKTAESQLGGALDTVVEQIQKLQKRVDERRVSFKATVEELAGTLTKQVESAEKQIKDALAEATGQMKEGRDRIASAANMAKQGANTALEAVHTKGKAVESAVLMPIGEMKGTLDQTERALLALVEQTNAALDTLQEEVLGKLQELLGQIQSTIDTALESLGFIRDAVPKLQGEVMPPLEALLEKLNELTTAFNTGVQTLNGVLNTGMSALDAIPATGIPKPLVSATMSMITSAIEALLPQIQAAAQQASAQITKLAGQIQQQVEKVKGAALSQVDTFVDVTGKQIEALLPPVKTTLEAVQKQMEAAVEQMVQQIDQLKDKAIESIREGKARMEESVTSLVDRLTSELDKADQEVQKGAQTVRETIATSHAELSKQAEKLVKAVEGAVDKVGAQVERGATEIEQKLEAEEERISKQIQAFLEPIEKQAGGIDEKVAAAEKQVDEKLGALQTKNARSVEALRGMIQATAKVDERVGALRAKVMGQLAEVREHA
jgi:phage-related protein